VEEADWSPDGRQLAVVRDVNGVRRLEYPVEKVIYSTAGYISHVRVSPSGDRVAFLDHPVRGDNAGLVAVVDQSGRKQTLGSEFLASEGLAWSPSGQEIWFAAARSGSGTKNDLWAVGMDGKERLIWREAGPVSLRDVSRDGRVIWAARIREERSSESPLVRPPSVSSRGSIGRTPSTCPAMAGHCCSKRKARGPETPTPSTSGARTDPRRFGSVKAAR
jgi:Tol biopolymer transport system component